VALVWTAADAVRTRALPPGEYRLRTTRLERVEDGAHWFVSSTAAPGAARRVAAGETLRLDVDPTVVFRGRVQKKHGKLHLGFVLQGRDGRGLSIYRADKRVPVTYRVVDSAGNELASGTMNYG